MNVRTDGGHTETAQPIVIQRLLSTRPYLRSEIGGSLGNIPRTTSPSPRSLDRQTVSSSVKNLVSERDSGPKGTQRLSRERSHRGVSSSERGSSLGSSESSRRSRELPIEILPGDESPGFLDSGDEIFEESTLKRPLYVDCAETGQRRFRMEFDAEGFGRENITVTLMPGSRLEIRAVQEETDGSRKSTSEFSRRIKIPDDVDTRQMACVLVDRKILVDAPLVTSPQRLLSSRSTVPPSSPPSSSLPSPTTEALNTPVIKTQGDVQILSLSVEVGRVFRSDDVTVKCRSASQLVITAERSEVSEFSRLSASLTREFDLPVKIIPHTLKAGITVDGLLKITAQLSSEDSDVDNDGRNTRTRQRNVLKET